LTLTFFGELQLKIIFLVLSFLFFGLPVSHGDEGRRELALFLFQKFQHSLEVSGGERVPLASIGRLLVDHSKQREVTFLRLTSVPYESAFSPSSAARY